MATKSGSKNHSGRRGPPATAIPRDAGPVYLPDDLGYGAPSTQLHQDSFEAVTPYRFGFDLPLLEVEDRRLFSPPGAAAPPLDYPSARTVSGSLARLRSSTKRPARPGRVDTFSPVIRFDTPGRVNICIRRAKRKQVLFAKNFYGKSKMRRPKRNAYTSISCRR